MTTDTKPFRICQNNQAAASGVVLTASSELAGYPVSNSVDYRRFKKLIFSGNFTVTSTNKKLYINDGSDKTVSLTEASYATGTLLAAHIQTQLNASSSNWTCTYSTTTYKFTIGRSSGTATLRMTQTTDSAWDMLGYLGTTDVSAGTGLAADEVRIHTSEKIHFDLLVARSISAFHLLGAAREAFGISSTATATLKANNVDSFTSPPVNFDLSGLAEDEGLHYYFDAEIYRYWEFEVNDRTNPSGPQIAINYLYLGDYVAPTLRNLKIGFTRNLIDPSTIAAAVGQNEFVRVKRQYWQWTTMEVANVTGTDRTELERCFKELGSGYPFICSLDPAASVSESVGEFTKFMRFLSSPTVEHQRASRYSIAMEMREVI